MRAVIVDDESNNRTTLRNFINKYTPGIEVIAEGETIDQSVSVIEESDPDILFLDIQLKDGTGFDLLKKLKRRDFNLIFVTAYDQYAINAFRFSAIDYILKPIDPDNLIEAVGKCKKNKPTLSEEKIDLLLGNAAGVKKIAISTLNGIEFIRVNDIVRCQSDSNYTVIYLLEGKKIMASKTLREFDDLLSPVGFYRIHKSNLVNLQYVERYISGDGGYVEMIDKSSIDVSRRKKDDFLKKMT